MNKILQLPQHKAITIAFFAALLCSCSTNIPINTAKPGAHESIIIFGVKPSNARIFLNSGEVVDGKFKQDIYLGSFAKIQDVPADGYVSTKLKAGETLALTTIQMSLGGSRFGPAFSFCKNQKLLSFEVPSGKVAYAMDVEFTQNGDIVTPRFTNNIEAARSHLKEKHPYIANDLVQLELKVLPASRCI